MIVHLQDVPFLVQHLFNLFHERRRLRLYYIIPPPASSHSNYLVHVPLGSLPSVHFSFPFKCDPAIVIDHKRGARERNAKNAFQINCRHHRRSVVPVPVQVPTNWVSNLPHHRTIIAPSCGGHHQEQEQKFPLFSNRSWEITNAPPPKSDKTFICTQHSNLHWSETA